MKKSSLKKNMPFIFSNLSFLTPNLVKTDIKNKTPHFEAQHNWVLGGTAPLTSRRSTVHFEAQHHLPWGTHTKSMLVYLNSPPPKKNMFIDSMSLNYVPSSLTSIFLFLIYLRFYVRYFYFLSIENQFWDIFSLYNGQMELISDA